VRRAIGIAAALAALALPAAAAAQVQPYRANDAGGFRDVLPPGQNGRATGPELAAFVAAEQAGSPNPPRPRHSADQLAMYAGLLYGSPGLAAADLERFFKDSSFGVPPDQVERTYSPGGRTDVTILRDRAFGIPHVYGSTREGTMFGVGYATAEDRLFVMDVLRHAARSQLSSFAGGSPANRADDQRQWQVAPYHEAELQAQYDRGDDLYGAEGAAIQRDAEAYLAGVNRYVVEAKMDAGKMPGEYAVIQPEGPDEFKVTDIIAIASLIAGRLGNGGGGELASAEVLGALQRRYGRTRGRRLWRQMLANQDPETTATVHGRRFPYQTTPRRVARGSAAVPDRGSVTRTPVVESGVDAGTTAPRRAPSLLGERRSASNALVVSARESASGRPLAVFGPQTGYFAPNLLMEQDVHGPGIDARGVGFVGTNVYVQLGRGRDYAWSATSSNHDIIDTFVVDLCDPGGAAATRESMHYFFRGQCLPIEVLRRTNSWEPKPGIDDTPAGTQTLRAERTKLGLVVARATVGGRPVAFTRLRSTYHHEVDSAGGFYELNDPGRVRSPQDFQRAAARIGYTFNWFYVDHDEVAYMNSGANPLRARNVDPMLPTRAAFEWQGLNPDLNIASYTPPAAQPQALNQSWMTSWNNAQAHGFMGGAAKSYASPVYRSSLLDDRVRRLVRGPRKATLTELVDAMTDAATVDLRADRVLPLALAVIGRPRDPTVAGAVAKLRAWRAEGSHRIDRDRNGRYEHSEAIAIMDAWWPRMLEAMFKPAMGAEAYDALAAYVAQDNHPNNHGGHLGSAWDDGWYGFAHKDLRAVLRRPVRGRYVRLFCGGGSRPRCRRALSESLRASLRVDRGAMYADEVCSRPRRRDGMDAQACYDSLFFRLVGGIGQPLLPWQNRPTYQQVVEIPGPAPR
jgi:acyl-homoserine lactone acylase PvdQ